MGRILFAAFLLMPLVEIALFIVIGNAIGLWPTLGGVLVGALAGAAILRRQGLALVTQLRDSMGQRQLPARTLADAMMVALAGMLLLVPGYFSDLIGLLLLLPPVRTAIYGFLARRVQVVSASARSEYGFAQQRVEEGTIELGDDEYRPR